MSEERETTPVKDQSAPPLPSSFITHHPSPITHSSTPLHSSFIIHRSSLVVPLAALLMLAWSWKTWCDPLVDFGTQLYIPWQMTAGKVLYRDLAYYNGPLSQYVNAGLFMLLGVSLRTLVLANLMVLTGVLVLIHRLALRASGPVAATACGLTFVLLFAFGQGVGVANYNWITPYTHEITHGIAIGFLSIAFLGKYVRSAHRRWLCASGVAAGLVFLTKTEPFIATLTATVAMLIAGAWINRRSTREFSRDVGTFLVVMAAIPLVAFLLMSLQMPISLAARGVAGSWPWVFDHRVTALPFYQKISGTDDVIGNLLAILRWSLIYTIALTTAIVIGLRMHRPSRAVAIIAFIVGGTAVAIAHNSIDWGSIIRPLPICLLAMLVFAMIRVAQRSMPIDRLVLRLGLVIFAISLLMKISLDAGIPHYGFALAMPGVLLMVAVIFEDVPGWIRSHGGDGGLVRAIGAVAWLAAVIVTLYLDQLFFAPKQWVMGSDGDAFRVDRRGLEAVRVIEQLRQFTPELGTLVVLPQGLMLNYVGRRTSPIPFLNFMPPEVLAAGEHRIIAALAAHPPDAIVLDSDRVNAGQFIMDESYAYGRETLDWVRRNYDPIVPARRSGLVLMLRKRSD